MTHEELLTKLTTICPSGCSIRNEHWHEHLDGYTNKYLTALRAVVELHKPSNKGFDWMPKNLCDVCLEEGQEYEPALDVDYPCSTIQTIEKELS